MMDPGLDREREDILRDLTSPDEEVRRLAVERAMALPIAEAVPRWIDCLGDPDWRVRKAAVERLAARADSPDVISGLLAALADGENPGRRNSAVEALVALGEASVPRLIETLASDDVDVRKLAVDALAGVGSTEARSAMIATLEDLDPNVRAAAADALGAIGGEEAVARLSAVAVRTNEDPLVAFSALRALGQLEVPMRVRDLAPALDDATLRPAALGLLGRIDEPEAVERLLKGVVSGGRAAREAAMESLLRLLSIVDGARAESMVDQVRVAAGATPALMSDVAERLEDADLASRLVLVQFLGLVGGEECARAILEAGHDEAVREVAHGILVTLGADAERGLDTAWEDLDADRRRDACDVLGRLDGQRSEGRLLSALEDTDAELRAAAARALGQRGATGAIPALVRRLEAAAVEDDFEADEEQAAMVDALVALCTGAGTLAPAATARTVELLTERLDDADAPAREAIAWVLARVGRPEDVERVGYLLKDPSSAVRRAAVDALARLDAGAASEPLRLALADESPAVRVAAASALGASRIPEAVDDLRRGLHDEDDRVRAAAVRAIAEVGAAAADGADPIRSEALALVTAALGDSGVVAMAGAVALDALGGSAAAEAARALLDRPEPELVQAAIACIRDHGDAAVAAELVALLGHESWAVRGDAIRTLAERRVAKAVPAILRRLETEQDDFVRDAILRALERLEG